MTVREKYEEDRKQIVEDLLNIAKEFIFDFGNKNTIPILIHKWEEYFNNKMAYNFVKNYKIVQESSHSDDGKIFFQQPFPCDKFYVIDWKLTSSSFEFDSPFKSVI